MFIDARDHVTRIGTESYLTQDQISYIGDIFDRYEAVDGVSFVASLAEIRDKDYSLEVIRYVKKTQENILKCSIKDAYENWEKNHNDIHVEVEKLIIEGGLNS